MLEKHGIACFLMHGFHWVKWTTSKPTDRLALIPAEKKFADFRAFSQDGIDRAHGHLNYETVACHPAASPAGW